MTQSNWTAEHAVDQKDKPNKLKFFVAGGLILVAIIALVIQALFTNSAYFITAEEYHADSAKYADRDVTIGSWVIADSVEFEQIDAANSKLTFEVADDINDPATRITVIAYNEPIPDTMQGGLDENMPVQAIIDGRIDEDGSLIVHPNGLKTKCPSRYEGDEVAGHTES